MEIFTLKRGDTSPALKYELGVGVNLAGASAVFQMRRRRGARVIDAPAVTVSQTPPVLGYAWQPGDSDEIGNFEGEFSVTYADGTNETFPNRGFIPVLIGEDA